MRLTNKAALENGMRSLSALALGAGLLGAALVTACGDEDAEGPNDGMGGAKDGAGGSNDGGSAGAGGAGSSWIVGGWLSTEDAYTGYLTVVDDISSSGSIELGRAVEFEGDIVWKATEDGVVFVGQEGKSTIERWVVTADGDLEKDGEVSFQNFGVTDTLGGGRNVIQLVDADTAYYFDKENLQVITFDPESMTTGEAFSLGGLEEEGARVGLNFIHRDGDRFIVTARYWSDDENEYSLPLTRAAFVDSASGTVSYADDTRCGEVAFNAVDADGNLYVGSHHGNAVAVAAGLAGDEPSDSCILRINKGAAEFDEDYYVDLTEISGGGIVGGLLQGPGDTAYVYAYAGPTITPENFRGALRGEEWELHAIELGDEETSFTKVKGLGKYAPYGDSFTTTFEGAATPFVTMVDANFASGRYFDMSKGTTAVGALGFPGFPGHATALR
jgi:hypothetical protein